MDQNQTALILIGYQNDYFNPNGILSDVIEESSKTTGVLRNTITLLNKLAQSSVTLISTPIFFTPDYSELDNPTGILQQIKEVNAFQQGSPGSQVIPEIQDFSEAIIEIPGKRGLNAFSNTDLHEELQRKGVSVIVLAGVVTSLCIDSTARAAYEKGYTVAVLSDCTSGRSDFEQKFYCDNIFPLYAQVMTHQQLLEQLGIL